MRYAMADNNGLGYPKNWGAAVILKIKPVEISALDLLALRDAKDRFSQLQDDIPGKAIKQTMTSALSRNTSRPSRLPIKWISLFSRSRG